MKKLFVWGVLIALIVVSVGLQAQPVHADGEGWPFTSESWEDNNWQTWTQEWYDPTPHKTFGGDSAYLNFYRDATTNALGLGKKYKSADNSKLKYERFDPITDKQVFTDTGGHCIRNLWGKMDCTQRLYASDEDVSNVPWGYSNP
jgi:hypothetical protein